MHTPFSAKAKVALADATQTKRKGNTMNDTTSKIAALNDRFRKSTLTIDPVAISFGRKFMTSGIQALGLPATVEIAERVAAFDSFTGDNDPHREHDFGAFELSAQD